MRPAESEGLEPPDGMTSWPATELWRIDAIRLGEVAAPQIHAAIPVDTIVAGIEAARDAIRTAAVTAPWKRFAAEAGWTDRDFEARLYLRTS